MLFMIIKIFFKEFHNDGLNVISQVNGNDSYVWH